MKKYFCVRTSREHNVADTLLPMTLLGLRKLGNICCGHKNVSEQNQKPFLCPGHNICVLVRQGLYTAVEKHNEYQNKIDF